MGVYDRSFSRQLRLWISPYSGYNGEFEIFEKKKVLEGKFSAKVKNFACDLEE